MQCPRCGTENNEGRASCWNCFAPLRTQAAVVPPEQKAPKEKVKKGKQVEVVQPVPEPAAVVPEVAAELEPVTVESPAEIAEPAEETPVFELAEEELVAEEAEPEPASSPGFFLPQLEEPEQEAAPIDLAEEETPSDRIPWMDLMPEPEPEQELAEEAAPVEEMPLMGPAPEPAPEIALAEPSVEEEVVEEAPLAATAAESDEMPTPSFLGEPKEEEEDLGVHEPKVFDLGEVPELETPEEEPSPEAEAAEEDLGIHEPKVFDLGEAPEEETAAEEPISEPEAVEEDLGVHEPKVFDLGEVPELETPEEEPIAEPETAKADLRIYEPKVFDLGVVLKAPPEPPPAAGEAAEVEEAVAAAPQMEAEAEVEEEYPEIVEPVLDVAAGTEVEAEEETPDIVEPVFEVAPAPEIEPLADEPDLSDLSDLSDRSDLSEPEGEAQEPPAIEGLAYDFELESESDLIEPASEAEKEFRAEASPADIPAYNHVPGLAEPEVNTEPPQVEVPELPVFDLESIETAKAEPSGAAEARPARQRHRSALPGFAVTIILLLLSTWGFINAYPPPGSVAKSFVVATDSLMAGDTSMLSRIVSADSQKDIAQISGIFQPFKKKRLKIRIAPQEVVERRVMGSTADVIVLTNIGIPNSVQGQGRLTIALVKEGSVIRKQWKVDLAKTGQNWKTELPKLLKPSTTPGKGGS